MEFKDKINQSVAAAVAKIMGEALHPNQQKLDVHEPEKDELTAADFKKLRSGKKPDMKKEEVEVVYEANIEPTSAKSRTHIGNLSNPVTNSVVRSGKEIGLITKQPSGEFHAHHSAAKLAHSSSGTFDTKDKAHQFIRDAHAKAIKNGTLKASKISEANEEIEIEEESHQSKTTMKHIPNPTPAQKQAAKDIKPGVGGYRDRIAMLKDAGVKEEVVAEGSFYGNDKMAKAAQDSGDSKATVRMRDAKGTYTATMVRKQGEKDHKEISRVYDKEDVKEEVEAIDEVKMADLPSTKVQGRSYGASKPQPSAFDVLKGPKDKELKSIETEKKKPVKEDIELTLDDYLLEELVEFVMSEEFQQLDELSKSTLGSYVTKASKDLRSHSQMAGSKDTALMAHQMGYRRDEKSPIKGGTKGEKRVSSEIAKHQTKASNRTAGIAGAAQRLAKEQFEITEEDAYDKNVKPSDKPHDKDAAKKRAETAAHAARKVMSMSAYSASKKSE